MLFTYDSLNDKLSNNHYQYSRKYLFHLFLQATKKRKDFHEINDSVSNRVFVTLSSDSSCSEFKDLEPIYIHRIKSIFLCVINRHILEFLRIIYIKMQEFATDKSFICTVENIYFLNKF